MIDVLSGAILFVFLLVATGFGIKLVAKAFRPIEEKNRLSYSTVGEIERNDTSVYEPYNPNATQECDMISDLALLEEEDYLW